MATAAHPLSATVLYAVSLDSLARDAETVVVASVPAARRAYWHHGRIVTDVRVTVTATLKGTPIPGATLLVRLPGGVVDDVGQTIAGAPVLAPDTTVVLYLTSPREGARNVVSFAAGVLPMTVAHDGTLFVLPARTEGITFLPDPRTARERTMPGAGVPLHVLATWVREAVR
jgi:hypothetical protein